MSRACGVDGGGGRGKATGRPDEVLPHFVDLAIELTGGISAGLSLLEEEPVPGVFRWTCLRRTLSPFTGATTPRDFSRCGITLDRNAPVLSQHPERVCDWIAAANITVPEVLLVPLCLGGKDPLGTLWVVADTLGHFDCGHSRVLTELASFVGIALRMLRSEEHLQQALHEQEMLAKEMSHRLKNYFAMTEGLIFASAKGSTISAEMAKVLAGRLRALANAHALVRRDFSDAAATAQALDLAALIRTIVCPYEGPAGDRASRFRIEGSPIHCGDHAKNGAALVFHELATNAAKYGALKVGEGRVDIDWHQKDGKLVIRWIERDGPQIDTPPTTSGFGSALAQGMIVRQFNGSLDCDWRSEGLAVTIPLPVERLLA